MNLTFYEHKDYGSLRLPEPRKNKANFPIEDRSLSRLVSGAPAIRVKLSEAKSRLVGISDFDILNFGLQHNNHAKQTQCAGCQKEPKPLL